MSSTPHRPRVTALIDTYNQGRFIEEAVESVLSQDFPAAEMEILVVDDGSTDDTAERVKEFAPRVRYVRKENGGQASALNLGFQLAQGEIIAMLDGDDVWLPQKIRRVVAEFRKNPAVGMVYHPYQWWDTDRNICRDDADFPAVCGFVPGDLSALLRYGDTGTCGMAFRADVLQKLLPIPEELIILADAYLIYLGIFPAPVAAINECLTRYRLHSANLNTFQQRNPELGQRRLACSAAALAGARRWLEQNDYDLKAPALAAYLKRHELVRQMVGFLERIPSRAEFFRYLWLTQELYRPVWSRRYRVFRAGLALAGYLLGYSSYSRLRDLYRDSGTLLSAREWVIPRGAPGVRAPDAAR